MTRTANGEPIDLPSVEPGAVDGEISGAWFDAARCRNCNATMNTPHCGQCGQKAAHRLSFRDMAKESWDRLRYFELKSARTLRHLLFAPGRVAREYVQGRRTAHMNPLALLIALVALLVLMLAANQYFQHYGFVGRDSDVDRMSQRVLTYANWSFSLGIFAIFMGSWITFRRRQGYNAIEHAVLAIYCQCITLALILVNLLPTLIWRDPAFIVAHKAASQYYMTAIKLLIVAVAYRQFFLLQLRRDWPRLALACGIYAASSWLLLRAYAAAILWLVTQ